MQCSICGTFINQPLETEGLCEGELQKKLLADLVEYVSVEKVSWSVSPAHVKLLGRLIPLVTSLFGSETF